MKITRRQVRAAARYEPLQGGEFVKRTDLDEIGTCPVCMVGGALRRAGLTNTSIQARGPALTHFEYITRGIFTLSEKGQKVMVKKKIARLIDAQNYLGALSCFFEELVKKRKNQKATKADREKVIRFVGKHFPKEFDTNDAREIGA